MAQNLEEVKVALYKTFNKASHNLERSLSFENFNALIAAQAKTAQAIVAVEEALERRDERKPSKPLPALRG